jgi:hypothetical protein
VILIEIIVLSFWPLLFGEESENKRTYRDW